MSNVLDYGIGRNGHACFKDSTATETAKHHDKHSQQEFATEIDEKKASQQEVVLL